MMCNRQINKKKSYRSWQNSKWVVKSFAVRELKVVHTQFWQKEATIKHAWMKSGDETFKKSLKYRSHPPKKQSSFIKSKTERSWEQHCGRRYHRTYSPQSLVSFNIFNYSFQVISPHSSSNGAFYRAFRWWGDEEWAACKFLNGGRKRGATEDMGMLTARLRRKW